MLHNMYQYHKSLAITLKDSERKLSESKENESHGKKESFEMNLFMCSHAVYILFYKKEDIKKLT